MSGEPGGTDEGRIIEVELKFPLRDPRQFRETIVRLGAVPTGERRQRDVYLAHPQRNFAKTDEALRIRTEGNTARLTYKGPRIDTATKSRLETEITLARAGADARRLEEIFARLEFPAVRTVVKTRELFSYEGDSDPIEIAIDTVDGLGTFVELERAVPPSDFESAKRAVLALAQKFGLSEPEHRSYLGMLLANEAP